MKATPYRLTILRLGVWVLILVKLITLMDKCLAVYLTEWETSVEDSIENNSRENKSGLIQVGHELVNKLN